MKSNRRKKKDVDEAVRSVVDQFLCLSLSSTTLVGD
jgi:hypothetical protein